MEDFCALEGYLARQAACGLFLTARGRVFSYYRQGEAAQLRYRVDNADSAITAVEYRDAGWQQTCAVGRFVIYQSAGASALAMPRDDLSLQKKKRVAMLVGWFLVFVCVFLWGQTLLEGGAIFDQTHASRLLFPTLTLLAMIRAGAQTRIYFTLKREQKCYADKRRKAPRPKSAGEYRLQHLFIAGILVFVSYAVFYHAASKQIGTYTPSSVHPTVALSHIESTPDLFPAVQLSPEEDGPRYNTCNFYQGTRSLWMPQQCEVRQMLEERSEKVPEGGQAYAPQLQTNFYRIRWDFLADWLIWNTQRDHTFQQVRLTEDARFDRLLQCFSDAGGSVMIAQKGKAVLLVQYQGKESPETLLAAIAGMEAFS